ncbi:MAG: UvrD-helicase domain-containing protein [Oligoflexia bacterium]|nr:UvrD-helicase domain-containing protein [Oligoflexia bacterium]
MIDFNDAPDGFSVGSPQPGVAGRIPAFINSLNDRQREAALTTEGPLIVLAGAGSGKTKMLTARIAYLIEGRGVAPWQVLGVTFTNKAAGEMRERVEKVLRESGSGHLGAPEIGTFHSVCIRILRREIHRTPFTKPFVIYDDADQLTLIKGAMNKLAIDEKSVSPKGVQSAINRAKCDALQPEDVEPSAHNFFERQFKRIYEQYQKDMFANNAIDFGEIICLTYRLLRDHPDLRSSYQRRFRYIHVDEYQDTNRAQCLLLSMLAAPMNGGHGNICVVGDEDQSIYKWRGADIRNILDFEREYPGARIVKLEQNYRSSKTIIRAAGEVIKNNTARRDKTLWTDNPEGVKIIRAQVPDERAEAEFTVSEIKRVAQGENRPYGDFSIFYRTNAQSRQFEDVLRREKIPYQIVGGLRFYDRKEIKDILSYFKAILNPSDSVSIKRIINTPARGIGKTTLDKLDDWLALPENHARTFWDALAKASSDTSLVSAGTGKKLAAFIQLMERFIIEQPKLTLSELYHLILDETAYVVDLRKEGTEEALARIENLEEFDTLLQEFDEDNFFSHAEAPAGAETKPPQKADLLALFIEQTSLASDVDKLDDRSATVKLMTLHSSKGLEFPVVFLAGMEDGLFPSIKNWEETPVEDIEEERRLCYVGMTRAREKLYLMNAVMRRIWGDTHCNEPSRFFLEMPSELLDYKDYSNRLGQGSARSSFVGSSSRYLRDEYSQEAPSDSSVSRRTATFSKMPGTIQNDLVGRQMSHADYGPGTIIAVDGAGDDRKVTVEFRGRQQRKFMLRYVASYIV